MDKILRLDPNYDLWLSYTWSSNNHGICGHTYEIIDYYYILKNHFKVGILLAEDIDWDKFEKSIRWKYNFTDEEIQNIKDNIVFGNRPSIVTGKNILFTDGGIINNDHIKDFQQYKKYGKLLAIVNVIPKPIEGINFVIPPIENLFEKFDTYIYTPVDRKWDCSPRFIAECKHYGKKVIYHNIDYWEEDHGLRVRKWDIDNDFDSLHLKDNDNIIEILKGII